jgi:hypothetical protein
MSTKSVKRRVAPLEHVVHPEGHVTQEKWKEEWHPWSTECILKGTSCKKNGKRRVAPLEHVVRPEGHVAQGKQNEASGTLGAPSAS